MKLLESASRTNKLCNAYGLLLGDEDATNGMRAAMFRRVVESAMETAITAMLPPLAMLSQVAEDYEEARLTLLRALTDAILEQLKEADESCEELIRDMQSARQ